MGSFCGAKAQTIQTNQSQTYTPSPEGGAAISGALGMAGNVAQTPFQTPQAPVAGFTNDQMQAFEQMRAAQGYAQPYFNQAQQYFSGDRTNQFLNPYVQNVSAGLSDIFGKQMRDTTGSLTQAAGGVGADRIAVGQANLAKQQGLAAGQTFANLYAPSLQAAQTAGFGMGQLGSAAQNAYLQGTQGLMGTGGLQQQLGQAQLNAPYQQELARIAWPYQNAQFYGSMVGALAPGLGGTTQGTGATTYPGANPWGSIIGAATTGLGALGGLGGGGGGGSFGVGSSPFWSGSPGGFFSNIPGSPGYYGGSPATNPALQPYAEGGAVDDTFERAHNGLSDDPINIAPQGSIVPNAPLTPIKPNVPQLNLNPPPQQGGGGSGGGGMGQIIGTAMKVLPFLLNTGGRVNPYAYAEGGGLPMGGLISAFGGEMPGGLISVLGGEMPGGLMSAFGKERPSGLAEEGAEKRQSFLPESLQRMGLIGGSFDEGGEVPEEMPPDMTPFRMPPDMLPPGNRYPPLLNGRREAPSRYQRAVRGLESFRDSIDPVPKPTGSLGRDALNAALFSFRGLGAGRGPMVDRLRNNNERLAADYVDAAGGRTHFRLPDASLMRRYDLPSGRTNWTRNGRFIRDPDRTLPPWHARGGAVNPYGYDDGGEVPATFDERFGEMPPEPSLYERVVGGLAAGRDAIDPMPPSTGHLGRDMLNAAPMAMNMIRPRAPLSLGAQALAGTGLAAQFAGPRGAHAADLDTAPTPEEAEAIARLKPLIEQKTKQVQSALRAGNQKGATAHRFALDALERELAKIEGPESSLGQRRAAALRLQTAGAERSQRSGEPFAQKFPDYAESLQKWGPAVHIGTGVLAALASRGKSLWKPAAFAGGVGGLEGGFGAAWPTIQDAMYAREGSPAKEGAINRIWSGDPKFWKSVGTGFLEGAGPAAIASALTTKGIQALVGPGGKTAATAPTAAQPPAGPAVSAPKKGPFTRTEVTLPDGRKVTRYDYSDGRPTRWMEGKRVIGDPAKGGKAPSPQQSQLPLEARGGRVEANPYGAEGFAEGGAPWNLDDRFYATADPFPGEMPETYRPPSAWNATRAAPPNTGFGGAPLNGEILPPSAHPPAAESRAPPVPAAAGAGNPYAGAPAAPQRERGLLQEQREAARQQQQVDQGARRLDLEAQRMRMPYEQLTQAQKLEQQKPVIVGYNDLMQPVYGVRDPATGVFKDPVTGKPVELNTLRQPPGVPPDASSPEDASLPPRATRTQAGQEVGTNPEVLEGLDPGLAANVRAINDGRMSLSQVPMRQRYAVSRYVNMYNPNFDQGLWGQRSRLQNDLSTNGNAGKMLLGYNMLLPHLNTFSEAAEKLAATDFPAVNTMKYWWLKQAGDPRVKTFETARLVSATETARILRGVGTMSLEEIRHWTDALATAGSPRQLQETVHMLGTDLLDARVSSINHSYRSIMRREPPDLISPEAKEARAAIERRAAKTRGETPAGGASGAPPRPATVPAGSQYHPQRKLWRSPDGKQTWDAEGKPVQ